VLGSDGILLGTITNWQWTCDPLLCADDGFVIQDLDLVLDPDPAMTFGRRCSTRRRRPSVFSVVYQQSIVPTAAPGTATASLPGRHHERRWRSGSGHRHAHGAAAGISTDTDGIPEIMVYSLSTNGGTTWSERRPRPRAQPFSLESEPGQRHYGPVQSECGRGAGGSGNYDTMRVDVNFQLSGRGNDRFQYSGNRHDRRGRERGREPATGAQLALGLLELRSGPALARS
jgi:hypothetical protein